MAERKQGNVLKKRLAAETFETVVSGMNLTAQNRQIAFGVLVEGGKQKDFARQYGITPGAVSHLVNRVLKRAAQGQEMHEQNTLPPGFVRLKNVILPQEHADYVRKLDQKTRNYLTSIGSLEILGGTDDADEI